MSILSYGDVINYRLKNHICFRANDGIYMMSETEPPWT